ncbi:hypothetical protein RRG08_037632 [Elysia crispata]|uniref:Uncharacterized protein n=1 Tax=Elysia crispata TaxID=231223 RepID=A0AAE0YGU4_9GAST|nr:hypothetical protein RRG08_037632 [Elysia crispata]
MVGLLTFTSDGFTLPDRSCLVSGPFSVGDDTRLAADKVPGKVKNLCKECCLVVRVVLAEYEFRMAEIQGAFYNISGVWE